ncbi:type II toxin-antitoxin system RelE/ParE family toxin [Escherichia coli]|nr:type II toxin-antitoxin system RelE/ParE family toxin [Escherichia coli]EKQ0386013.1 type II toxin-antitoxin system RelE/ParE family toxin [Escherichia coli]EKR6431759.1 type II toxin-antitoxin system RelE/ParE family toxin [Escherichia coli]
MRQKAASSLTLQQCLREYIAEQNLIAAIELDERIGCSASLLFSLSFISVQVHDNIITV